MHYVARSGRSGLFLGVASMFDSLGGGSPLQNLMEVKG